MATLDSPVVASGSGTLEAAGHSRTDWTGNVYSKKVYQHYQAKAADLNAEGKTGWAKVEQVKSVVAQVFTWIAGILAWIVTLPVDFVSGKLADRAEALDAHKLTDEGIAEGLVKHGSDLMRLERNNGERTIPFARRPEAGKIRQQFSDAIDGVTLALAEKTKNMDPVQTQAEIASLAGKLKAQVDVVAASEKDTYNYTMVSPATAGATMWGEYTRLGGTANRAGQVRMDDFIMTLVGGRVINARVELAQRIANRAEEEVRGGVSLENPDVLRDLGRHAQRIADLTGGDPVVVAHDIRERAKAKVEAQVKALAEEVGETTPEDLSARLALLKKLRGLGGSIYTAGQRVADRMDEVEALSGKTVTVPVSVQELRDARSGGTMADLHSAKQRAAQAALKGLKTEMAQTDGRLSLVQRRREHMGTEYDRTAQALVEDLGVDQFDVNAEISKAERLVKAHEELAAEQAKLKPPVVEDEDLDLSVAFETPVVTIPVTTPRAEERIEEEPGLFDEPPERVQEISSTRAHLKTAAKVLGGAAVVGGSIYGLYSYLRGGSQPVESDPYPTGTGFVNGTLTAPNGTQFRSTDADRPKPGFTPVREEVVPEVVPPRVSIVRDSRGGTPTGEPLFREPLSMPVLFPQVDERANVSKPGNFSAPIFTPPVVEDRGNTSVPVGKFSAVHETSPVSRAPSFLEMLGNVSSIVSPANITANVTVA